LTSKITAVSHGNSEVFQRTAIRVRERHGETQVVGVLEDVSNI